MAGTPKDFSGRREEKEEKHNHEQDGAGVDLFQGVHRSQVSALSFLHLFLHNQVGTAVPERLSHGTRRLVRMWIKAAENRVYDSSDAIDNLMVEGPPKAGFESLAVRSWQDFFVFAKSGWSGEW